MEEDKSEINGYIQHVSAIEKSGDHKMFHCNIQTEGGVVPGVSFSPSRKRHLETLMAGKSPVKINKYRKRIMYGEESIIIDEDTNVVAAGELNFEYKEGIDVSKFLNIESLSNVAIEQVVNVKATIKQLQEVKLISTAKGSLRKQEGIALDPAGYINITFWEDQVEVVENDKTYEFQNLRLK
eukprot:gene2867-3316_t